MPSGHVLAKPVGAASDRSPVDPRASAFVQARLTGRALAAYPGPLPATDAEAYAIQRAAIDLWPDAVAGWKVGRFGGDWPMRLGIDRLAGPIFARQIARATAAPSLIHVFAGGFGAIESEIIVELASDPPAHKRDWTLSEALEIVKDIMIGAEIASSPFAAINDHGPLVTISDFGNNNGLILGQSIPNWRDSRPDRWIVRTGIEGVEVGRANAGSIPGGPFESLRALLVICAAHGLPLRRGMLVSTGAVTGVHIIRPGQSCTVELDELNPITCQTFEVPYSFVALASEKKES